MTQEEDCLNVKCGESGWGGGEQLRNSYIVVSNEAMDDSDSFHREVIDQAVDLFVCPAAHSTGWSKCS